MEIEEPESEPNILYEHLTLAKWHQNLEIGLQKVSLNNSSSYFNPWRIFEKSKLDNKKFLQTEYAWQLAVSQDGKVIAILQESLLEIRTAKDEYSAVVGKAQIPLDQYPQLRKASWSSDNTFLAVARDNGVVHVFNLLGNVIATIQPSESSSSTHGNTTKPVVGLLFLQPKLTSTQWSNELFVFYNDGQMRSILLSSLDDCNSEENANCSLEHYFPQGITSVASHSLHHTFVIAGNHPSERDGMSVWRVLNDYPHLKIASGFEKDAPVVRSLLRFFPGYSAKMSESAVIKMRISPNGEILASLHYSGDISLWQFPGIRLIRRWSLSQQPNYNKINPENLDSVQDEENFHPVDICWWSDTALAVARKSGAVTVCSLTTLDNLLGESPEFLSYSPQITSINGPRSTVIALECETENNKYKMRNDLEDMENENETSVLQASIQAALYSFTDMDMFEPKRKTPRLMQRTYRLIALKCTTPDELYTRKIESEDYESALLLAHTYNLDCDLVYQKQWKSTNVTKESIYDYLGKIKDTLWVANECIERVPDTIEITKELLKFGLKKTEMDHESVNISDPDQKKLVSLRRKLLSFSDNLIIYQKMIDSPLKYNPVDYDEFRRKSPLLNTVHLARSGNWSAVSIMLTYRGNVILKYWLPILSNFPETLPPLYYRTLLPEISGNEVVGWEIRRIRHPDWSEDIKYKDCVPQVKVCRKYLYHGDLTLKYFEADVLTPALVGQWYLRRVYEMEKYTGMVENAFLLACLGKERNIKCLDPVLFNLRTLYCLVYVIQVQDITLRKLESLPTLEQAKLLFSQTTQETFIADLNNYLHPFANRCLQRGLCTLYSLLQGLLIWLSEDNLVLPLEFFMATKQENGLSFQLSMAEIMKLAILCIYNCKNSDQLENGYLILECLPMRTASETIEEFSLHDKIDTMENHLQACDIFQHYKIYKPARWLLENQENKTAAMQVMQEMASYAREKCLDFNDLEYDFQQLQSFIFKTLDPQYFYELVAFSELNSENERIIRSAASLLQCTRNEANKIIPFERSVELVVKAAKFHFQKATSFDNFAIRMSQRCLSLINEPHALICQEFDLIESVHLLHDFDVQLLPIQVRHCTNRMKLIEYCLQTRPTAYKATHRLILLAHSLRIYGHDRKRRECEVLVLAATYALQKQDFDFCREICSRLVARNFPPAWDFVFNFTQEYKDLSHNFKEEFAAFALLHCPNTELSRIAEYRRSLHEGLADSDSDDDSGNYNYNRAVLQEPNFI